MKYFQNVLDEFELKKISDHLNADKWRFGFTSTDPDKPIWNFNQESGRTIAELIASKFEGYNQDPPPQLNSSYEK